MPKAKSRKKKPPKRVLALPDLEHAKTAVLNSLTSASGQRTYEHAIREFVAWYCSEPRLAFNRTVAASPSQLRTTVGSAIRESEGALTLRSRERLCADDEVANTPIRTAAIMPNRRVLRSIMLSPFIWRPGQLSRQSFNLRSQSLRSSGNQR